MRRMVAKVKLFAREMKWCQKHAERIVNHYGGHGSKGSGAYNHNKISSNLVGVKSEKATVIYLKRFIPLEDIEENYIDFTNTSLIGDLNIYGQSIEIKGLRPHQWDKFKRMIPPKQLKHYVRDESIVVWTTASGDTKNSTVKLMGWNYAHEVQTKGVDVQTICANVWLENDEDMHPIEDLPQILRRFK